MSINKNENFEYDFKFIAGKYKDKWLSEINDLNYIEWFLNNNKLNEKNKKIFINRYEYLYYLNTKKNYEKCEGCGC